MSVSLSLMSVFLNKTQLPINQLLELKSAVIIILRAGVLMRGALILIQMHSNEDEKGSLKKLKNLLFFYVLAELAWNFKEVAEHYWR